jgi:5'-nucleotidase
LNILIVNDDGIQSLGIRILAEAMEKENKVLVVAPQSQRSACGHSITLEKPLSIKEEKLPGVYSKAYSIDGTPADCVRIGVDKISDHKIDLIISGINKGYNLGINVLYSGTVSAAVEGVLYKIPSIAISTSPGEFSEIKENYETTALSLKEIIKKLPLKSEVNLYNINVPGRENGNIKGIKVCPLAHQVYTNVFTKVAGDKQLYDLVGEVSDLGPIDRDVHYIEDGYITITPIKYDLTDYSYLDKLSTIFKGELYE